MPLWGLKRRYFRLSVDDLLNDVIQYDQKFCAGYFDNDIFGQRQVGATYRDHWRGVFL